MDFDEYGDYEWEENDYEYDRNLSPSGSSSDEDDEPKKYGRQRGDDLDDDDIDEPDKEGGGGKEAAENERLSPLDRAVLTFIEALQFYGNAMGVQNKLTEDFMRRTQSHIKLIKNFMNYNPVLLSFAVIFSILYNIVSGVNSANVTSYIDKIEKKYKSMYSPTDVIRYIKIYQKSYDQ